MCTPQMNVYLIIDFCKQESVNRLRDTRACVSLSHFLS